MELKAGDVVAGRFKLDCELGRGGMGAVWRAHHLTLDAPCAVKFIDGALTDRDDLVVRFQREAQAAAQIRSPNVVQILDFGVHDALPYIAMELLEGEDLAARMERVGRLDPESTLRIIEPVARALAKAHRRGIVHRDLKPENIFLAWDEGVEVAKVLDFGIAKDTRAVIESTTQSGVLMGTPFYMSPEQARGERDVDARADLWSLGVVTFQCLTGQLPFTGNNLGDLLAKVILGETPLPTSLRPDLAPEVDAWWRRAVARQPDDRFQDALTMVRELARALGVVPMDRVSMPSQVDFDSAPTLNVVRRGTITGGATAHTLGGGRRRRSALLVGLAAGGVTLLVVGVVLLLMLPSWGKPVAAGSDPTLSPTAEPSQVTHPPKPAAADDAGAAAPESSVAAEPTQLEPVAKPAPKAVSKPPTLAKPPPVIKSKPKAPAAPSPDPTKKKIDFGI